MNNTLKVIFYFDSLKPSLAKDLRISLGAKIFKEGILNRDETLFRATCVHVDPPSAFIDGAGEARNLAKMKLLNDFVFGDELGCEITKIFDEKGVLLIVE